MDVCVFLFCFCFPLIFCVDIVFIVFGVMQDVGFVGKCHVCCCCSSVRSGVIRLVCGVGVPISFLCHGARWHISVLVSSSFVYCK